MLSLLTRKPVKDAVSIPGAITKLENDLLRHAKRTGFAMPEQLKVPDEDEELKGRLVGRVEDRPCMMYDV